jgi:hypothetical protein
MNIKLMAIKIIIAIASIIGILPAIATSIDVCMSSLVHLQYSAWYHIRIVPSLRIALPLVIILCCLGILYSFNLQLKIKQDPGIHDIVFPILFLAIGGSCLLAAADIYFSRAASYTHSAIFHMNVHKYRIGPFCFIAMYPCIALFIYTVIAELISITKKTEEDNDEDEQL